MQWYTKEVEIDERLAQSGSDKDRHDLTVSYIRLGDACKELGDLDGAKDWYTKSMEIRQELAQSGTYGARRNLTITYNLLGDVCKAQGDLDGARAWYTKCLEIRQDLAKSGTDQAEEDLRYVRKRLASVTPQEQAPEAEELPDPNDSGLKRIFYRLNALFHDDD